MATLADLARQYLAQSLPDISGIFKPRAYTPVEETPVEETVPGVTPQLLRLANDGGNFNIYNVDPNKVRTNYINPFPFNPDDNLGTSDYGYIEPGRGGILGLMDAGVDYFNNSLLGRGIKGVRNMLPVNPRAILENELIGKGLMIDDIGRIVTNNYNTPEGIMAGYNAAKMDASTFDDRIAKIQETINRKTAANPNYDPSNLQNRIDLINQAKDIFFGAKDSARVIADAKKKEKDPTYKTLDELVTAGLAEGDDDDDDFNIEDFIAATNPNQIPTGITGINYPGAVLLNQRNVTRVEDARRALEASRQRAAEAAFAAAGGDRQQQAMQRARDQQAIDRAYRDETGAGSSYSGGERTRGDDTSYSDPFDPGGGE